MLARLHHEVNPMPLIRSTGAQGSVEVLMEEARSCRWSLYGIGCSRQLTLECLVNAVLYEMWSRDGT
jgi:hypothetical protein